MTTPMSTPRQPFAELSGQRLQHLTSVKNRQNGVFSTPTAIAKSPLSNMIKASPSPVSTSKKRAFEPSPTFEDGDSENVDPSLFLSPTKKTKGTNGLLKPSSFSFSKPAPMNTSLLRKSLAPTTPRANISTPRTPNTAPAGRSPPRKKLDPKRRISAPYTRIDPPSSHRKPKDAAVNIPFFSFEEALAGSLHKPAAPTIAAAPSVPKPDVLPGMPKSWFFAIHEDTPDQEAENLMEHSTKVLDLSSDEEGSGAKEDRGKENVAPADFVAPVAAAVQGAERKGKGKKVVRRRKVVKVDEMDDGERKPLGEVEREDFFPEGVRGDEVVVVDGEREDVVVEKKEEVRQEVVEALPPVQAKGEAEDIVIFED
ncbi:hypothetical protein C1H76_0980 [Elsinoe australis]|uniref:Uncharacterized protein n=1 Tax=Elsinoe australis TaxID=40998 RepID=A0A4U7B9Z1_9PEZI|nr:hypothetical protein C1H76_0980 [Elsinoe australis]